MGVDERHLAAVGTIVDVGGEDDEVAVCSVG
jgi:hypothetical protein